MAGDPDSDLVDLQADLARRLREARVARKLTQEDAAARAGIGSRRLQDIEAGRVNLTLRTLVRLAAVYGVSVRDLFTGDRPEPERGPTPRADS